MFTDDETEFTDGLLNTKESVCCRTPGPITVIEIFYVDRLLKKNVEKPIVIKNNRFTRSEY